MKKRKSEIDVFKADSAGSLNLPFVDEGILKQEHLSPSYTTDMNENNYKRVTQIVAIPD